MFSVKTLSGDIITLVADNEEEFEKKYKEKYIKEKYRSFVTLSFFQNDENDIKNIIVNIHDIPYFIDLNFKHKNSYLILNNNPKTFQVFDTLKDDTKLKRTFLIFSNKNAMSIIKEFLEDMKEVTDDVSLVYLARNTNDEALDILSKFNRNYFMDGVWDELCYNPNPKAFEIILQNMDYIISSGKSNLEYLNFCQNPTVIEYLNKHQDLINWTHLSENPMAMDLLLKNRDKIYYKGLCNNPHPEAVKIIIRIIEEEGFNSKKIDYFKLFSNTSEILIDFIINNINRINNKNFDKHFRTICINKSALYLIEILYKKGHKIENIIWLNEGIFRDDENIFI